MGILAGLSYLMGTGQAGAITYPKQGQNPGLWTTARLTNASPFPVVIRLGGQYLDTLPAWTANVYPLVLPGQGQGVVSSSPPPLTYQCVTPANAPPAGSGDSTLYTDFGLYGDQFLGTYPQPLAGQAVAAAVSGSVALSTLNGILFHDGNSHTVTNVRTQIYAPFSVATAGAVDLSFQTSPSISTAKAVTITINWIASDGVSVLFQEIFTMAPGASSSAAPYNQDDTRRIIAPVRAPFLSISAQTDASTSLLGPFTCTAYPVAGLSKLPDPFRCTGVHAKAFAVGESDSAFLGAISNIPAGWATGSPQMPGEASIWTDGGFTSNGGFATINELQIDGSLILLAQINTKQDPSSLAGPMNPGFRITRNACLFGMSNGSGAIVTSYGQCVITPR